LARSAPVAAASAAIAGGKGGLVHRRASREGSCTPALVTMPADGPCHHREGSQAAEQRSLQHRQTFASPLLHPPAQAAPTCGSMKNLSPLLYDVASTPSDIFTVKYCAGGGVSGVRSAQ
jgi:hypothetical protein